MATSDPAPASGWVKVAKDVFAGTCGGISVTLVGHPFDTLKVRLQTQPVDKPIYNGVLDCAQKTIKWEGLGGLYKGVTSPLAGQMVFRASLFGAFGEAKRWLARNPDGSIRALAPADFYKAGAITGFVAAFTEGPIDFYKSQIQVQIIKSRQNADYKPPYTSVSACVKATWQQSGLRGPFQGLTATLVRNTPANAIYLGNFEMLKAAYCRRMQCSQADIPGWVVLCSAGLGGVTYWLSIFPVDCIKSAMQTDSIVRSERKYPDFITTAQKLWAEGGIKRFYKGFTPCIIRAAPANGVMLLTVEKVQALLKQG
ncbi:mitochondrial carrier [Haematococcus lacustris]